MGNAETAPNPSSLTWGPVEDQVAELVDDLKAVRQGGTIRILAGVADGRRHQ
jgi:hypothetical protein